MLATKPRYMLVGPGQFVRFFRFEDLDGNPEPKAWGPRYSKPAKPGRAQRREPPTNAPSGQPYDFDAAKHRAKLRAEFRAQAEADKRSWAMGKRVGVYGKETTIIEAYEQAMIEKARRLAG